MGRRKNAFYKAMRAKEVYLAQQLAAGAHAVIEDRVNPGPDSPILTGIEDYSSIQGRLLDRRREFAGAPDFTADLDQAAFPAASIKRRRLSILKSPTVVPVLLRRFAFFEYGVLVSCHIFFIS
jgi:hypothetical protein